MIKFRIVTAKVHQTMSHSGKVIPQCDVKHNKWETIDLFSFMLTGSTG